MLWCQIYCLTAPKPPFAGPETVLDYLARYSHRVAISNYRLLDVSDGHVRFSVRQKNSWVPSGSGRSPSV